MDQCLKITLKITLPEFDGDQVAGDPGMRSLEG